MKVHQSIEKFKLLSILMSDSSIHKYCLEFLCSIDTIHETLSEQEKLEFFYALNKLSDRSTRIISLTIIRNYIFLEIRESIALNVENITPLSKEIIDRYFEEYKDTSVEVMIEGIKSKEVNETLKLRKFINERMEEYL